MSSVVIAGDTSGSVTLSAPAVAGSTVLTLPAQTGTVMVNGPAFSAYQSSTQSLTINVATKIVFQTEEFDTANAFDSTTNYRFNPLIAGYYQIIGSIQGGSSASAVQPFIYKNGAVYKSGTYIASNTGFQTVQIIAIIYFNGSTDYVEMYASQNVTQALTNGATNGTYFSAAMIRSA